MKFYTGRALADTPAHRDQLRRLIDRIGRKYPIVTLNTNLSLDEHADYVFQDIAGLITLDRWMTPQNNLAVQTEVIRRASRFVGYLRQPRVACTDAWYRTRWRCTPTIISSPRISTRRVTRTRR